MGINKYLELHFRSLGIYLAYISSKINLYSLIKPKIQKTALTKQNIG